MKWFVIAMCAVMVGCEGPPPMTPEEVAKATDGQPEVFVPVGDSYTLSDTPEFYLGQSEADALAALEQRCKAIVDYEGDWRRANTFFKGCRLPDDPEIESIRIGFQPAAKNRVFTLEVKRVGYSPELVRGRFTQIFREDMVRDVPRRATVRMETGTHLMFGSWDDGPQGAVHLVFGLSPAGVEGLSN